MICQILSLKNSPNVNIIYCGQSGALKLINFGKNAAKNKIALGLDNDTQTPVRNSFALLGIDFSVVLDNERGLNSSLLFKLLCIPLSLLISASLASIVNST